MRSLKPFLVAAGLAAMIATPAWTASLRDAAVSPGDRTAATGTDAPDAETAALHHWQALLAQNPAQEEGCFRASYPSSAWEKVDCGIGRQHAHPVHRKPADGAAEVTGNGHDYVAEATGLITSAFGSFSISGVKSETGVGVAGFGGGGILGPNEYSVQLNTNALLTTSACAGHTGCHVWQQFVYATDYIAKGEAAVFMQYWLLDWGSSACPGGWNKDGTDCYRNSGLAKAPDLAITDLGGVQIYVNVTAGGNDSVMLSYGSDSYSVTAKDSVLDISAVWNKVEFNVVGDAGGSRADFNGGSSIKVTADFIDGSSAAPKCVANDGTTGETNNLNLGACKAFVSLGFPIFQFTESN